MLILCLFLKKVSTAWFSKMISKEVFNTLLFLLKKTKIMYIIIDFISDKVYYINVSDKAYKRMIRRCSYGEKNY